MTTDTIVNTLLDAASIQQCEKLAEKADLQRSEERRVGKSVG